MKVLIVEDDEDVVDTITLAFQVGWPGIELVSSSGGQKAVEMAESEAPNLIILDIGLPDISGFEVLRRVRTFSNVPIIILTVMNEENDIIKGLEWGADDYVTKPFRKMELLARVKAVLRRRSPTSEESPVVCGLLRYEPSTYRFFYSGKEIFLTVTEANILLSLMKKVNQVVSNSSLAIEVWGDDYEGATDSLKVHIRHLREKLEVDPSSPKLIITKPRVGYSLVIPT
ncbi:MAG: response regulator transcription factor [Dehalococcoidales bacterium]|nr:response regulator transcription factor [Dehalococcoidales bacterium]